MRRGSGLHVLLPKSMRVWGVWGQCVDARPLSCFMRGTCSYLHTEFSQGAYSPGPTPKCRGPLAGARSLRLRVVGSPCCPFQHARYSANKETRTAQLCCVGRRCSRLHGLPTRCDPCLFVFLRCRSPSIWESLLHVGQTCQATIQAEVRVGSFGSWSWCRA